MSIYLSARAATPGSTFPSRSSREAPPPVEMWLISPARPDCSQAATESPPPIMVIAPSFDMSARIYNSESSSCEFLDLEYTHRSIHDYCLTFRKSYFLCCGGSWAVIKSHPSLWDLVNWDGFGVSICTEGISDNNV